MIGPSTGRDGAVTQLGVGVGSGVSWAGPEVGSSAAKTTIKRTASPKIRAGRHAVRQTLQLPWTSIAVFAPRSAVPYAPRASSHGTHVSITSWHQRLTDSYKDLHFKDCSPFNASEEIKGGGGPSGPPLSVRLFSIADYAS
jgi:hypothetical protein